MQDIFSNALSNLISKHIKLSPSRRETLTWLAFLIMQQGTICLWRLAAYVSTRAQTASVRRRFYRFFQFEKLDIGLIARVIIDVLHLSDKPWVLAIDRTNWDFGTTTINILMISVMFQGVGIPLMWALLPGAGNSDTQTRISLLDQLFEVYPDLKIASLRTCSGSRYGTGFLRFFENRTGSYIDVREERKRRKSLKSQRRIPVKQQMVHFMLDSAIFKVMTILRNYFGSK